MDAIAIQGLTKRFSAERGVFGLDLMVAPNEIFGFLGPNGAGKTTTIRLLLDFIRPQQGKALVLGLDCQRDSVAVRSKIGYLPGEVHLFEKLTGRQFLDYMIRLRGTRPPLEREKELVGALGIDLSMPIKLLSKGNKQKIGLLQALVLEPPLLILDEPTEGLDPLVQHTFHELLGAYRKRGGTVFMSSHVLSEVERICDRVAIIRAGKLVAVERLDDLIRKKVRQLDIVFSDDVPQEAFLAGLPGATIKSWTGRHAILAVPGSAEAVVKHLGGYPIADLTFAPGSLEEAFLEFYR